MAIIFARPVSHLAGANDFQPSPESPDSIFTSRSVATCALVSSPVPSTTLSAFMSIATPEVSTAGWSQFDHIPCSSRSRHNLSTRKQSMLFDPCQASKYQIHCRLNNRNTYNNVPAPNMTLLLLKRFSTGIGDEWKGEWGRPCFSAACQ